MMQLSDLAAYALEQYHIEEQHKWADFPGFSVLSDAATGKWLALLMRRWDTDTGTEIQLADIKCGRQSLTEYPRAYLSAPFRMDRQKWVGVRFTADTEPEVVCRLFDRAVHAGELRGWTLVVDNDRPPAREGYHETPLPFAGGARQPDVRKTVETAIHKAVEIIRSTVIPAAEERREPKELRQMRKLYSYGDGSFRQKCKNFYYQGRFMADYEDDVPWQGDFRRYYPTYHDLTPAQLRGYFTWRTAVRRGEFRPVPTSLAYIYIYELLNGIGTSGPEDSLEKLRAFQRGYTDTVAGDASMEKNLSRWMLEMGVLSALPPETVRQYAPEDLLRQDEALAVLKKPESHTDPEIFSALCTLGGDKLRASPVVTDSAGEGERLFAMVWRRAAAEYREPGKSLFTACFGARRTRRWHPLGNAVYYSLRPAETGSFELNECRKYTFRDGVWREQSYDRSHFDKKKLPGLLHETERRLRAYLGTGRTLKERPEEAWAAPFVEAVLEEDRRAKREAARAKVTIHFDDLERIRSDAALTRESLLTEEELGETESMTAPLPEASASAPPSAEPEKTGPLDAQQRELLAMLLRGESVTERIRAERGMPTVIADAINEALFDDLGDSAVECDGEDITLVEDYREDVEEILGGYINERT